MELRFPWDIIVFFTSAVLGFLLYIVFTRPRQAYKEYKKISTKFQTSSLSIALGLKEEFIAIQDKFYSVVEVSKAIKLAGLESSNLIIGVDFTASNEWQGRKSFSGRSLHHIFKNTSKKLNPYQSVIKCIGKTLEPFDEDNLIPVYGFGDLKTKDHSVFNFNDNNEPCKGLDAVLQAYNDVVRRVSLSGPTSFGPIIDKAIEIVSRSLGYYILVIIADGQVVEDHEVETREAIVKASYYPISIIVVGVGDGPWDRMHEYDELLPQRKFDNFQFIEYNETVANAKFPDAAFALHALMEIPEQYKTIKKLGLLNDSKAN
ncbi:E3 ubiquitin-protein ligase RGLG5 [Exaiptasia diaphana]|uniref:VWFA domain-containing protein n=1 Tax=Exaiptasia diaphana TaxID=2652724 RepID=A0A913Y2X2_EXADI|nr:E3 ubiquitin-protein ligase RGLG5 [Exaiptasia diaphana]KXJ29213.1 E3 ubiquitin-protein ligase RGLG2 [Exaiptasia diaphana]